MNYLAKQKKAIEDYDILAIGSSIELIDKIETRIGLKFPTIYKEFLMICGSKTEHIFCGLDINTRYLEDIQNRGREIYQKVTLTNCPKNILFIMEHQNYSYYYFNIDESENPDIFLLVHGDEDTNRIVGKLSTILDKEIDSITNINK